MNATSAVASSAAIRLEALGKESLPTLKKGLSSQHPLVRFTSAEALAYLESTAGAESEAARPPRGCAHGAAAKMMA